MPTAKFLSTMLKALAFGVWAWSSFSPAADAVVPIPSVIGPLPSDVPGSPDRNYPFFATDMVLSDFGYVEEEFFYDGTANRYDTPNVGGIGSTPTSARTSGSSATRCS